jgi:hypothetical protein
MLVRTGQLFDVGAVDSEQPGLKNGR